MNWKSRVLMVFSVCAVLLSCALLLAQATQQHKAGKATMKNGADNLDITACQPPAGKKNSKADGKKDSGTVVFSAKDQDYWIYFDHPEVFSEADANGSHVSKGNSRTLHINVDMGSTQWWPGNCDPWATKAKKKNTLGDPNDITIP
ncbi:MAG: hypothetical protein ACRD3E_10135 [Terriglobales bacterium]